MPTFTSRLRSAALTACGLSLLLAPPALGAKTKVGADLRIVSSSGKTLADARQYTGTTRVRTSPKADCFGPGNEGSGDKYRLPGANATGVVSDAARHDLGLAPLRLTDAFYDDGFGLGVCAISGESEPAGFWFLKRNHVAASASGDQTALEHGDDVLWFLIDDFGDPPPTELELKAPARVKRGAGIPVLVNAYDDAGKRSRAAGVTIKGTGGITTNAKGKATVPAQGVSIRLQAVADNAIPSNVLNVCAGKRRFCPDGHLTRIDGTLRGDRVRTGRGPVVVNTFAGRDVVDVRRSRSSSRPIVKCGTGNHDKVIARKGQRVTVSRSCEKIKRV